jgi:hypothetical protein
MAQASLIAPRAWALQLVYVVLTGSPCSPSAIRPDITHGKSRRAFIVPGRDVPDRGGIVIEWSVIIHLATTAALTGIIWFVQLVHYPLFAWADRDRFAEFEARHAAATGRVVAPLMILELVGAVWLVVRPVTAFGSPTTWTGLGLVILIWLSTFAIQVPCHRRLGRGYDDYAHRRLVRTNWIRTAAWSARVVLLTSAMMG